MLHSEGSHTAAQQMPLKSALPVTPSKASATVKGPALFRMYDALYQPSPPSTTVPWLSPPARSLQNSDERFLVVQSNEALTELIVAPAFAGVGTDAFIGARRLQVWELMPS